jgi:hypothetical protein
MPNLSTATLLLILDISGVTAAIATFAGDAILIS